MWRLISAAVLSLTAAAAGGAYIWIKGKQRVESIEPVTPEATPDSVHRPNGKPLLTTRHNWLLDVAADTDVPAEAIINEIGVTPTMGWLAEGTIVLAVFGERDDLLYRKDGIRLRINPSDYMRIEMAAASAQAVPVFTTLDHNWLFRGFFVFDNPAALTARCYKVVVSAFG